MNGRTAKLIRRVSAGDDRLRRSLKARWKGATRQERAKLRGYLRNLAQDPAALLRLRLDLAKRRAQQQARRRAQALRRAAKARRS